MQKDFHKFLINLLTIDEHLIAVYYNCPTINNYKK